MQRYLFDTFCWIELLNGGPKSTRIKALLREKGASFFVSTISLAEISAKLHASGQGRNVAQVLPMISVEASTVEINESIAGKAGELWAAHHAGRNIGLADCIIAATALAVRARVVTGDRHFGILADALVL